MEYPYVIAPYGVELPKELDDSRKVFRVDDYSKRRQPSWIRKAVEDKKCVLLTGEGNYPDGGRKLFGKVISVGDIKFSVTKTEIFYSGINRCKCLREEGVVEYTPTLKKVTTYSWASIEVETEECSDGESFKLPCKIVREFKKVALYKDDDPLFWRIVV